MRVLIVGGGIGGLALGAALRLRGIEAELVERRAAYGGEGAGVVLGQNVMRVLRGLGLHAAVVRVGHPIGLARITDAAGRVLQEMDYHVPGFDLPATAIHRNRLHELLRAAAPAPRLGCTVTALTPAEGGVEVALSDGGGGRYDLVVGADGIRSAVRAHVCGEVPARYSGYTCWRFVVPGHFGDATVEMWGRGRRVGVVPLGEGQSYVFLTRNAPRQAPPPFADLAGFRSEFAEFGDPAAAALAALDDLGGVLHNDIEDCSAPRWSRGRVVLLGDAAHAVTPNLGQGAGLAIEDAATLAALLAQPGPPEQAIARYEALRQPRAAWIRDQSWSIGRVAQWESSLARALRDQLVRWAPERSARAGLERVVRDMPGVPVG